MLELLARYLLMLALTLAAPALRAQNVAPDALLRDISVKVIDQIKLDREPSSAANPANVAILVETNIAPLFDFVHMTRLAMARYWYLATPEQQTAVTAEFKTLLVRTYSIALSKYRDEAVVFKPLRAGQHATDVTVKSTVTQPGRERMTLDYDMIRTPAGWKIYDVTVAGVGLVITFREVFAEEVRQGGVDGLIEFLAKGNREGGSKFKSIKSSVWEKSRLMYAIFQNLFRGARQ